MDRCSVARLLQGSLPKRISRRSRGVAASAASKRWRSVLNVGRRHQIIQRSSSACPIPARPVDRPNGLHRPSQPPESSSDFDLDQELSFLIQSRRQALAALRFSHTSGPLPHLPHTDTLRSSQAQPCYLQRCSPSQSTASVSRFFCSAQSSRRQPCMQVW